MPRTSERGTAPKSTASIQVILQAGARSGSAEDAARRLSETAAGVF